MQSVSTEENYEGGFDEGKTTIHTLSFQAKINIYGPVRENGVIKQSEVNILDLDADPNLQDFKAEILARPAIFEKDTDGEYVLDTDGKRIESVDYTTIEVDDDYEILINIQEWPEDDEVHEMLNEHWDESFGDRRQEIVFIGVKDEMDESSIRHTLDQCLVKNYLKSKAIFQNMQDPFPAWFEMPAS